MRTSRSGHHRDVDLVRGAARRLGLQATSLVAMAVIVLVALSTALVLRQQNSSAEALLRQAVTRADDVQDPPAGTWLVLSTAGRLQASPGIPSAFPDQGALEKVTRSGHSETQTTEVGPSDYLVLTDRQGGRTIQAILDLGPQHRQRADLTGILLAVGAVGLALSAFAGTVLARRAVRPLSDALTLQRSFVADASHELRTPLTLLSTRAQILRRSLAAGGADPSVMAYADGVVSDAARMTDVVEELLVAADPWTSSELAPVELVTLCAELLESARDYADSHQVSLILDRPQEDNVTISGNAVGLRRAVLAILDNAIEHTPPSGTVTISVGHQAKVAVIDIADTGPGIAPTEIDRVFDRFHSGHHNASRRSYGLGLALAREVITGHHGKLTVETTSQLGTTFRVWLPWT
ncbi:MAG: HAMP domain-containing sensor histidine kinase [Dermatophilaceae bacterium]